MAQTKSGSSSRSTSKKTSTAKKPASKSTAKKSTAAKSTAKKKTAAPVPEAPRPIRREVGAVVLLFLALVAFICWFDVDAWLITAFRDLFLGLFGWGMYLMFPTLLLAASVLGFHKGRPVTGRLVCSLLLPLLFGAFVHLVACKGDYLSGAVIKGLWQGGVLSYTKCGGVLSGLLAEGLKYAITVYGGAALCAIAFFILLAVALRISPDAVRKSLLDHSAKRPHYAPEDYADDEYDDDFEPMEFFRPQDEIKEVDLGPRSRFGLFDIPLDDDGPGPETIRPSKKKKAELFDFDKEDELFDDEPVEPVKPVKVKKSGKSAKSTKTKAASSGASLTENVEPISVEDAAAIAGVELVSTDIGETAAKNADKPEKITIDKDFEAIKVAEEIAQAEAEEKPAYEFPPTELLTIGKAGKSDASDEIAKNRERLESTIRSFGVNAHIVGVTHGPTVTRYDLELDQGVKLNKLTNLAGDIALSLGVVSVRIAPIPDKISTVGVEVPNRGTTTVYLRELVESDNFKKASSKLSFAVGKDIGGNAIVGNISKLPHLLIAGTTGSGKSVCINSLILSLLYKSTPDEVRMIMIDPKMVELGIYNGMPHLYVPVVTDPKKAAGALQWSVVEMLKRYRLFSEVGVRDLAGYNSYQRKHGLETLPQVVIIIDELADLMLVASKEVEESICRVAQMGRASGMHLVIATQRPSADVITGLMKANIPSRIAFAVSSSLESRIIMDQAGAEKLIGYGDMLYCPLGIGKPMRVQGAFVSDEEREKVIDFVKKDAEATYSDEILAEIEKAAEDKNDKGGKASDDEADDALGDYDELLPDAVDVVLELKQASVSSLQRKLKLGYSRAARIVDQMEELGVVGPYEGSKPRKVLITRQQWQEMQYSTGVAPADTIASEFADVAEDADFAPLPDNADEPETPTEGTEGEF